MDYIYTKFHQILTTLLVDAYHGALHASLQDWVLICLPEVSLSLGAKAQERKSMKGDILGPLVRGV